MYEFLSRAFIGFIFPLKLDNELFLLYHVNKVNWYQSCKYSWDFNLLTLFGNGQCRRLNYLYQNLESMILQSIFSWKWFYWKIIRRSWFMEKFLYVTEYNETEKIIKKWLKYNYTMSQLTSLSKEDPSRPLCTIFCYYCRASDSRKRRVRVRDNKDC